jgi:hypothetical protein
MVVAGRPGMFLLASLGSGLCCLFVLSAITLAVVLARRRGRG